MRIKMRTTMAGPNGSAIAGSVIDIDQAQAYDLIERQFATQVEEAVIGPAETAEGLGNRRRKPARAGE